MKQLYVTLIIPLIVVGMLTAQEKELIILHTSDSHGRIFPIQVTDRNATSQMADEGAKELIELARKGEIGGMASLAAAVNEIRRKHNSQNVLLVDGGDSFSDGMLAKLTKGEANIRLMNLLGYEFMALGNHDFDFKKDRTMELAEKASFPMRGANVLDEKSEKPFLGQPYLIINKGGLKLGLIAVGYRNTPLTTQSDNIKNLSFKESSQILKQYLREIKEKADLVVVISHEGLAYDKKLAEEFGEIDLIIGGHSHNVTDRPEKINDTYVVQAFSHGMALGITRLTVNKNKIENIETEVRWLWTDEVQPDKEIAREIEKLAEPYRDTLFSVIGKAKTAIPRNYKSGSPFDFLVGQIMMEKTGSHAALLPGVGYGITLNSGDIRRLDLYALIPHDSKMVTLELQGSQLLKTLEKSAENLNPKDVANTVGGLIQTAGMEWDIDLNKPAGERISNVKIKGEAINPDTWYKIATHAGMLQGLHGYEELAKGRAIEKTDEAIVLLVEQYFKENKEVSAPEVNISVKN